MEPVAFASRPDHIERHDVVVMERSTSDDLPHIQAIWPPFEELVGLRGRKMYGRADLRTKTYTACTPVREDDDPESFGLETGMLLGGTYLRGRLVGDPSDIYPLIGSGMQELQSMVPMDTSRPLVEFYRRHNEVELWVPIPSATTPPPEKLTSPRPLGDGGSPERRPRHPER